MIVQWIPPEVSKYKQCESFRIFIKVGIQKFINLWKGHFKCLTTHRDKKSSLIKKKEKKRKPLNIHFTYFISSILLQKEEIYWSEESLYTLTVRPTYNSVVSDGIPLGMVVNFFLLHLITVPVHKQLGGQ